MSGGKAPGMDFAWRFLLHRKVMVGLPTPQTPKEWTEFWRIEQEWARDNPRSWLRASMRDFGTWRSYSFVACFNLCMEVMMARGKGNANNGKINNGLQATTWCDIPIVEQDFVDAQKVYGSSDVLVDAVTDLLEAGYRIGLNHNQQNDAFICSVTCRDSDSPNNGHTYNSFAETWYEALQIAMYKHYVKTKKQWPLPGEKRTGPKFG